MGTDLSNTASVHHIGLGRGARVLIAVLAAHAAVLGWVQHLAAPRAPATNAPTAIEASVWVESPAATTAPRPQPTAPTPRLGAPMPSTAPSKAPSPPPTPSATPTATSAPPSTSESAPSAVAGPTHAAPGAASAALAPAAALGTTARTAETVVPPSAEADYLHNPPPTYPRMSRRLGEQGTVVLRVRISAQGLPEQVALRTSSGFARLDQAALDAVPRWRFVPGQRNGVAEAMWFNVPVRFVLE